MPGTVDEPKWEKAKDIVKKEQSSGKKKVKTPWALTNYIYQNMGGKFHKKKKKSSVSSKWAELAKDLKSPRVYANEEVHSNMFNDLSALDKAIIDVLSATKSGNPEYAGIKNIYDKYKTFHAALEAHLKADKKGRV
jgi:hypothetical protein